MDGYALAAYTVTVHKSHLPKTKLPLNDFDGSGGDLLVELRGFFAAVESAPILDEVAQTFFSVVKIDQAKRHLMVSTEGGEFGFRARLQNVRTKVVTAQRTEEDAELLPLRSWLLLPMARTTGLMLTERFRGRGAATPIHEQFKLAFRARYPGFIVEFKPVAPEAAFKKAFDEGEIKRIVLTRHGIPNDIADNFGVPQKDRPLGTLTTVISAKRFGVIPKKPFKSVLDGATKVTGLLSVGGETYNEIRVEVTFGGSRRMLNVTTVEPPRVTFPFGKDRERPTNNVVWTEARRIAAELAPFLGFESALNQDFKWSKESIAARLPVPDVEN